MFKLVLKKILQALVTLWGLATIVFILFQAIPSDPARMRAVEGHPRPLRL